MASFYCIYEILTPEISLRLEHLKQSCHKYHIDFMAMDSLNLDYSDLPVLGRGDFLYNIGRGSKNLESLLINDSVTTFYIKNPSYVSPNTIRSAMIHSKANISIPKTIFHATNDRDKLKKYVAALHGFPMVIKASGGTLGVGTMIANDFPSLFSLTDFLISNGVRFMLRQFIKPKEVARLLVVGNRVIASNQKFIAPDDFRTSIKQKKPVKKEYPDEIQQLAITASHLVNYENTGVDIIIDENDKPYLLEVNMPHDFVTTTLATGINIGDIMIEHLIQKSSK